MTLLDLWNFIQVGGVPGLLFLALVGVFRGWWVPMNVHNAIVKDRDEWKDIALESMRIAGTSVEELRERRPRSAK